MLITCCVCGNEQGGFKTDYPLSEEIVDLRVCASCHNCIEDVLYSMDEGDQPQIDKYIYKLKQCDHAVDQRARKYIDSIIQRSNAIHETEKTENIVERTEYKESNHYNLIPMTTGDFFQGYNVWSYYGIITEEKLLHTDVNDSVDSMFYNSPSKLETDLKSAKSRIFYQLSQQAIGLGCNGLLSVRYNITPINENILSITVYGTAVKIIKMT